MKPRPLKFKSFDAVIAEVNRLHLQGYTPAGNWDLAQVCDHLAYFMEGYLDAPKFKVPWIIKVMFGRMVLRRILKQQSMPAGKFTPHKELPPPGQDEDTAVRRFRETVRRFDTHFGEYLPSPFFGRVTRDECRQLNLIHCQHHLGFLIPKG